MPFRSKTVAVSVPAGFRARRVGFVAGTDEELAALHAVEVPIVAERGSNRMPKPVATYIAFARKLPSQFNDHPWLAETSDGTPVACCYCWSNAAGDPRVMECDLLVRQDHRCQGIGSRLLATICDETLNEGRSLLTWPTFGAVPAGEAFSSRVGARAGRVNRTSELMLADVDRTMIKNWTPAERARDLGYRLEMVDGIFPEHPRADAATVHPIMQTAPREGLDFVTSSSAPSSSPNWAGRSPWRAERDGRCSYATAPGRAPLARKSPLSRAIRAPWVSRFCPSPPA